ncbi:Hypothetical protein Cp262_2152 [Corynebacterium pseudotuberculosis]|nr:Hypothetical protein Cp262_2152 [Corynebacterium pseudotuberculosis]
MNTALPLFVVSAFSTENTEFFKSCVCQNAPLFIFNNFI